MKNHILPMKNPILPMKNPTFSYEKIASDMFWDGSGTLKNCTKRDSINQKNKKIARLIKITKQLVARCGAGKDSKLMKTINEQNKEIYLLKL